MLVSYLAWVSTIFCFVGCPFATPTNRVLELTGFKDTTPMRRPFTINDFKGTYSRFMELSTNGHQCPQTIVFHGNGEVQASGTVLLPNTMISLNDRPCQKEGNMKLNFGNKMNLEDIEEIFISSTKIKGIEAIIRNILRDIQGYYYGKLPSKVMCGKVSILSGSFLVFTSDSKPFGMELRIPFDGHPKVFFLRDPLKTCIYSGPWETKAKTMGTSVDGSKDSPEITSAFHTVTPTPLNKMSDTKHRESPGSSQVNDINVSPEPTEALKPAQMHSQSVISPSYSKAPSLTLGPMSPQETSEMPPSAVSKTPAHTSSESMDTEEISMMPTASPSLLPHVSTPVMKTQAPSLLPSPMSVGTTLMPGEEPSMPSPQSTFPTMFDPMPDGMESPLVLPMPPLQISSMPSMGSMGDGMKKSVSPLPNSSIQFSSLPTPDVTDDAIISSFAPMPLTTMTPISMVSISPSPSYSITAPMKPNTTFIDINPGMGEPPSISPDSELQTTIPTPTPTPMESEVSAISSDSSPAPANMSGSVRESPSQNPTGTPPPDASATCFPARALVRLESGDEIRIDEVQVGDKVNVGNGMTSEVIAFSHSDPHIRTAFMTFSTESGKQISLTSSHYMYTSRGLVRGEDVSTSDYLQLENGVMTKVCNVEIVHDTGLFNPHTMQGDLVVNGFTVSTYTSAVEPVAAHALLAPIRLFNGLGMQSTIVTSLSENAFVVSVARMFFKTEKSS